MSICWEPSPARGINYLQSIKTSDKNAESGALVEGFSGLEQHWGHLEQHTESDAICIATWSFHSDG